MMCELVRETPIMLPCFTQGYFSIDKLVETIKKDGYVDLPISHIHDARQHTRRIDGCYIKIETMVN
ncbi:MAG: hypothetical protein VB096_07630 [Pseudoflavonifractor sp.]|nr:hypothetical protein [Pseudoflavonifractor sp.]